MDQKENERVYKAIIESDWI